MTKLKLMRRIKNSKTVLRVAFEVNGKDCFPINPSKRGARTCRNQGHTFLGSHGRKQMILNSS